MKSVDSRPFLYIVHLSGGRRSVRKAATMDDAVARQAAAQQIADSGGDPFNVVDDDDDSEDQQDSADPTASSETGPHAVVGAPLEASASSTAVDSGERA